MVCINYNYYRIGEKMKIITFDDIKKLDISPIQCYNWCYEALINKERMKLPPKISMQFEEGKFLNVMPGVINKQFGGIKIVDRYPNRNTALNSKILLYDIEQGECLAVMDGNWITAMRTGAVAANSIKLFAKSSFEKIAILGLGNTARATLIILSELYSNRKFTIKLFKYKNQEKEFVKRFSKYHNLKFEFAHNYEELIKESDVVISCVTYSDKDIAKNECFDRGVLVVPIHTRGFSNCDLFFDKVYCDDYAHVKGFKNWNKFKKVAEVSEVINGKKIGRENNQERILVYNVGIAIHDINYAMHIYQMLSNDISLKTIDFCEPKKKFYI